MITLIHGDNELQIRKEVALIRARTKAADLVTLFKPDALTMRQNLSATSMFFDSRVFLIEQFLEKGIAKETIDFIAHIPNDLQVVFVERKRLDRQEGSKKATLLKGKVLLDAMQKQVKLLRVQVCNDYTIFDFMDALRPGNGQQILTLYEKLLLSGYTAEEIFFMMIDQFRNLIIVKDLGVDALKGLHQFRKSKFESQARAFNMKLLLTIYKKLFEIEVSHKQKRIGEGSPFSLEEDLHFFLAQAFNT